MIVPAQQNRMPMQQQQRPPQYPTSGGGAKWHIPQQSSSGNEFIFNLFKFFHLNICFGVLLRLHL